MRKVKYSISVFVLLLVFIFNSELYQNYFQMFTEQFYYFDVIDVEDKKGLFEMVEVLAEEHGTNVFCATYTTNSVYDSTLNIYADMETKENLEKKYYISEGRHNSFFSGVTQVACFDFRDERNDFESIRFYFIGDMEQVREVRNTVYKTYGGGYIHKEENIGLEWLIWAVWGLTFGLLLILTWVDIQFQKKENFVKISVGASCRRIVFKNIVTDSIFYFILFSALSLIVGNYISLEYAKKDSIGLFIVFLIFNAILHLSGLRYNYKEVLYGANINLKTIGNCYILKAVSMMVTIITLSVAISLVSDNLKYFNMYHEIENYSDYSFVSVEKSTIYNDLDNENAPLAQIFYEYYEKGKVSLSVYNTVNTEGVKYFIVNENTKGIEELVNGYEMSGNCYYILMPKDIENSQKLAEDAYMITKDKFGGFIEGQTYKIIYYDDFELLYFDTSPSSKLSFGFEKQENPVMIYCAFNKENVDVNATFCDVLDRTRQDIMFYIDESEVQDIVQRYNLDNMTIVSVIERCEQYKDAILRVLLLNSVMFLFMLFLEVIIIEAIIRMEYMVKAKELAIKTMLGYNVWQKNNQLFVLNILAAVIATIAMIISSLMFDISTWYFTLRASIILLIVECVLIYYHIIRVERSSIPKVLKGGSL